jgi:hypothetical protein
MSFRQFVSDAFTGSNVLLENHTPDSGGTWVRVNSAMSTMQQQVDQGRCYGQCTASGGTEYYLNVNPASAEYDVEADVIPVTLGADYWQAGLVGRYNSANDDHYYVRYVYVPGFMRWEMYKYAGGVGSLLGSYDDTLSLGVSKHIKLELRDATKKLFVDGVERISSNDNAVAGAGHPGTFFWNNTGNVGMPSTVGLQLDNFGVSVAAIPVFLYQSTPTHPVVAGGTDGLALSEGNHAAPATGGFFDREAALTGDRLTLAARASAGSVAGVSVQPSGANADRWRLSADGSSWGAYGAALTLGTVSTVNVVFYAQARGLGGSEALGWDLSTVLTVAASGQTSADYEAERRVLPHVEFVQDGSSRWYPRVTFGDANVWEHDTSSHGDLDLYEGNGTSAAYYPNVAYDTKVVNGDTTTLTRSPRTGLTLTTRYVKRRPGCYYVDVNIASDVEKRYRLRRGLHGADTAGTATVSEFGTTTQHDCSAETFQACGVVRASSPFAVALIAGDGYANDWCLYSANHVSDMSWYNQYVIEKANQYTTLNYGWIKSDPAGDFTIRVLAGGNQTLYYALSLDVASNQAGFNRQVFRDFCDAAKPSNGYSEVRKMFWSTAWQLQRIKRHSSFTEPKTMWLVPSKHYSPDLYPSDYTWMVMGLNDSTLAQRMLDTLHSLSADDAQTAGIAGAGDSLGGAKPYIDAGFEAYCNKFLGYVPTQATLDAIAASATRAAAMVGQILSADTGGFEVPISYSHSGAETVNLWTAEASGGGASAARVGTDGGVTPHGGAWMAKLVGAAGGYGRLKALRFTPIFYPVWTAGASHAVKSVNGGTAFVEPTARNGYYYECTATGISGGAQPTWPTTPGATVADGGVTWTCRRKQIDVSAWVHIPNSFSSGGFRFHVWETSDEAGTPVSNTSSSSTLTTVGWQELTWSFTPSATTRFVNIAVEVTEAGTAYVDDVVATLTDPPYPGLLWGEGEMPDAKTYDYIGPKQVYTVQYGWMALKFAKLLIGTAWTGGMQAALDAIESTWPAAYWYDGNADKLRSTVWHPVRGDWLCAVDWAWPAFAWYVVSGGQMYLTAQQVTALYNGYPTTAVGTSLGANAVYENIKADGSYCETAGWIAGTQGSYQNGGAWFMVDAWILILAQAAGVAGALTRLERRYEIEVAVDFNSHEWLDTSSAAGNLGTCPATQRGYGWNAVVLAKAIPLLRKITAVARYQGQTSPVSDPVHVRVYLN